MWEKVGSRTLPEETSIHITGALIIRNMSRDHVGSYICRIRDTQTDVEVAKKQVELELQGNVEVWSDNVLAFLFH